MDYQYLKLRLQTFRREYFDISSKWLKDSWSWVWHFTIDNFKYLYLGEIQQIRYLNRLVAQQRNYIELLQDPDIEIPAQTLPVEEDRHFLIRILKSTALIILMPIIFCIYWLKRTVRIIRGKRFSFALSPSRINNSDSSTVYKGKGRHVFLNPEDGTRFPRGLVIFRYRLSSQDKRIEPQLHIDPGSGFTQDYKIALPWMENSEMQELLLELPPFSNHLKLEISSQPVEFEIDSVTIKESNFFHAAWYLKTRYHYGLNDILHALFIKKLPGIRRPRSNKLTFPEWHQKFTFLTMDDRKAIEKHIDAFPDKPLVSIIIHTDNEQPVMLDLCIKSLIRQIYQNWELLVSCAEPPDAHVTSVLNKYERRDRRVKLIINDSDPKLSSSVKQSLDRSNGKFSILLEYRDILEELALYHLASCLSNNPGAKLIYSDFAHIDQSGVLSDPVFNPDWNHELFLAKNYIQYLACYATEDLKSVLNKKITNPFLQSSDLNLSFIENLLPDNIFHVPYILLYHRAGDTENGEPSAGERQHDSDALAAYLQRTDKAAQVMPTRGGFRIRYELPEKPPLVSLIVLTRDRVALLSNCIHGLLSNTSYKNIEIIIVDNGSVEESTLSYINNIEKEERVKVIRDPSDFNFSALNNMAVEHTSGEYIGLVNNDISIIEPQWLDEMMGQLLRDDVGIVGAKLLYENNTVQHAGVIVGLGGVAGHHFRHEPAHASGYDDRLLLCQELSCVTAACLLTKKTVYQQVAGLDAVNVRIAFNDVDYCLKVRQQGYKVIWTPFATLYHLESASRGSDMSRENIHRWNAEYSYMRDKWQHALDNDPFYNPNLAITDEDFSLANPPRLVHPWDRFNHVPSQEKSVAKKVV